MMISQFRRFSVYIFGATSSSPLLLAALLSCYIIWGSTYFAIQVALPTIPPFFQMGTRFIAASSILFAWAIYHRRAWPTAQQWKDAAISGGLIIGGGMGLLACSQEYLQSSMAAALTMLEPLLVCIFSMIVGWRPSKRELWGVAIGIIGILVVCSQGSFQAQPLGIIYVFASVTCWSVGSVLFARKIKLAPGAMGLASQMLCGAVVLMLVSFILGETPQIPTMPAVFAWLYLVFAGSLGAYCSYMYLVKNTSPAIYTSYNYVAPVLAVILGVTVAGESLKWTEALGMAICVSGIVLLLSPKHKK